MDGPLVSLTQVPVEQRGLCGRKAVNGCWMGLGQVKGDSRERACQEVMHYDD